jgi:hypothetical protein
MRRGDDSGAALILVLIVVTVLGLVLGALLTFTDTGLRATLALRDQASSAYNADGAVQAAINNLRNSTYDAAVGQQCFAGSNTLALNNFYGADSAAVTCSPDPAKVLIQCPSLAHCNRPGTAILTLGRIAGEDGLNVTQPNGSAFNVHGVVFSNSNINMVKGSLVTNAAAYARGACTGTITSNPPVQCNYGAANALGNDPGYAAATATVPVHQNLPACTTANSVVTFLPGYYDDAVGLSQMMAGNSSCKHSTWWFKPGTYYFDFHNGGTSPNSLLTAGSDIWTVNDGYLVAGSPVNSAGAGIATPPVPATIPGSCDNPINHANAQGVQFIFGGDSQLAVKAGQAELCGTLTPDTPPVALYGLTSGAETTSALTLKATAVTPGDFTDATVAKLATVDGNVATWTNNGNGNGNQTGTVTTSGYAPPAAIPAGSILRSAKVRVYHANSALSTQDNLSLKITPTGGTAYTVPIPISNPIDSSMHNDLIDISQGGTGILAQQIYAGTFTGAQIQYSATVKHKGNEQLDEMQLELSYVAPALRAENGCTTAGPYTGVGNATTCAMVTTVNNSGGLFYVQGTTYAPAAALDITLNNATEQVFRFGVIARSLWVKETGSFAYIGPVIEVPDDSPGFVLSVFLQAYICPKASTCTPGGTPALTAKVAIVDADPTAPVSGRRQISVLSWSSRR